MMNSSIQTGHTQKQETLEDMSQRHSSPLTSEQTKKQHQNYSEIPEDVLYGTHQTTKYEIPTDT